MGGGWVVGGVGGWVGWGGFGRFSLPFARVFEAQLSSLPQHVVPRTVPTRRHQLTEIALPDGCRVPYGGGLRRAQQVSSHPRADCCYARRSATPLQQLEGFKRETTIVSAELDDEAAVIISCPREGGGGPVQSRRRAPDDKYSPHSQTRLLTRPAVLWCVAWVASAAEMSRPGRTLRLGLLSGLGRAAAAV